MGLDPELFKQLLNTFRSELDEQVQVITTGLLKIEKNSVSSEEYKVAITSIFRAAHNIKGSARSLSIHAVGDIAHQLESLFSAIEKKNIDISPAIIDVSLEAVDKMQLAINDFIENKPISFDLNEFIARLNAGTTKIKPVANNAKPEIPIPKAADSMRISIDDVDHISAYMEEMQATKISLADHYTELSKLTIKSKKFAEVWKQVTDLLKNKIDNEHDNFQHDLYYTGSDYFKDLSDSINQLNKNMRNNINELNIISSAMQDEIRMLRLIPAATLFNTLQRYVRDVAKELDKQIELKITGDELKIDKVILERLKDPINHLLRNCIDHGIESKEVRANTQKSETGLIKIDIKEREGQVYILITDDGAGIDSHNVANVALEKGIITQSELDSMSQNEILSLVFRHGFSTKKIITDISGRGVGLDVVKTNIDSMNGRINLLTETGKYTTFELRVPLSLSSERGLLIKTSQQMFVIPTNAVEHVLVTSIDDIFRVEGGQAIMVDNHPVRFCILSDVFGLAKTKPADVKKINVVILNTAWKSVALMVDDVMGEREMVIKPLQEPLTNVPCVSGCTLYGNNLVVPVLDPNKLIDKSLNIDMNFEIQTQAENTVAIDRPHVLVVDDSITTRTLEKNILESKNFRVTVAVNGKEAWDTLQNQKFSLVITDVSMPIMDGFTLTEMIKKSDKFRDMPVIIVTSLNSEEEKIKGATAGANAYIVKNEFESTALLEIIEQLI